MGLPHTAAATAGESLPGWVPEPVRLYLAHTEGGATIRALARGRGCHPSTVLRQVRRTENLRDDPLADAGLTRLGQLWAQRRDAAHAPLSAQDPLPMTERHASPDTAMPQDTLRVLRALMEPKTILVIADGVEDAVVVHDAGADRPVRRAVVRREVAEALALRELISGRQTGRLARYAITAAGRAEAGRLLAQDESRRLARTVREAGGPGAAVEDDAVPGAKAAGVRRSPGTDAPLHVLARRQRTDGEPWLPPELIAAALRFRENWEIARIGGALTRDWGALIAGRVSSGSGGTGHPSGLATRRLEAEQSLEAAIRALGPELAETVLLGVCQEQGMEDIEKRLAFPARSGKIVLRIALRMLARHYASIGSGDYDLIY